MSDLELLISKHLDDELSSAELAELRRRIASDPDARAAYQEMTAIRRAARRAPTLGIPHSAAEMRLFAQLRREGFSDTPITNATTPRRRRPALIGSFALAAVAAIVMFVAPRAQSPVQSVSVVSHSSSDRSALDQPAQPQTTAVEPAPLVGVMSTAVASNIAITHAVRSTPARGEHAIANSLPQKTTTESVASDVHDVHAVSDVFDDVVSDSALAVVAVDTNNAAAAGALAVIDSRTDDARAPDLVPIPGTAHRVQPLLSATLQYGSSLISRAAKAWSEDVSVGLGINLGRGHRLAVLGGRSAAVTEQRAVNTLASNARVVTPKDGASLAGSEETPPPYDVDVGSEWWMGVGYNYSMVQGDKFELAVGARGGVGVRSLHLAAELPIRYHISDRFAVELIPTMAHVVPHDRARNEFSIEDASDGYLYEAESEQTSFSTYGGAVGIRIVLD